jgi:hypothetical protein
MWQYTAYINSTQPVAHRTTQQERKNQRGYPVSILTYYRRLSPPTTASFINKYSTEGGSRRLLDKGLGRRVVPLYQCTYPIYLLVNHDLIFLPTHHPTSSSGGETDWQIRTDDRTAKARPRPQQPHHHPYEQTAHGGTLGPRDNRAGWPTFTTQNNEGQPTSPAPLLTGGMRVLVTNDRPRQPLSPVTTNAWQSDQGQLIRGPHVPTQDSLTTRRWGDRALGCCQADYCESILAHCKTDMNNASL